METMNVCYKNMYEYKIELTCEPHEKLGTWAYMQFELVLQVIVSNFGVYTNLLLVVNPFYR
jgi:hypothetical protein